MPSFVRFSHIRIDRVVALTASAFSTPFLVEEYELITPLLVSKNGDLLKFLLLILCHFKFLCIIFSRISCVYDLAVV